MKTIKKVIVSLLAGLIGFSAYAGDGESSKIKTLTDQNFQKEIEDDIVIVDFWATWCYPCKIQGRIIENMMSKLPKGVTVGKVDTDANPSVSSIYSIRSIPTIIIFKKGKIVKRFVGVQEEEILLNEIKLLQND